MGKSKANNKSDSSAKKAEQEIKEVKEEVKKDAEVNKAKQKAETGVVKPEYKPPEQPKMTFYTIMALISALVSVGAAFCCAIVSSMPVHYILEAFLGNSLGDMGVRVFESALRSQEETSAVASTTITLAYVLVGLVVVAAILSIYTAIVSINPEKKPNIIISLASFALLLAAGVILPFYYSKGTSTISSMNPEGFECYNIFIYQLITVPAAAVCALINIFGHLSGSNRYTRDGKAF